MDGHWHDDNHATIWRWRSAYQNDFAARMDWTIKPYAEANHPPVPKLGHAARAHRQTPAQRVDLSADGTTDPDGDALSYEWFYYGEAGTFTTSNRGTGQLLEIKNFDQPQGLVHRTDRPGHAAGHRHHAHHPRRHRPRHAATHPLPARDRDGRALISRRPSPMKTRAQCTVAAFRLPSRISTSRKEG